jgi:hypothetical protein
MESMSQLKLLIEESTDAARMNFTGPDMSMRSSNIDPLMMGGYMNQSNRTSTYFFEDVKQPKHEASVGCDAMMNTNEQGTDVKNLVNFSNFGCGTAIKTVEKELNTKIDTNEVGSQMHKDVKEVCCDGSIMTDNKGMQMRIEGIEQEVNC